MLVRITDTFLRLVKMVGYDTLICKLCNSQISSSNSRDRYWDAPDNGLNLYMSCEVIGTVFSHYMDKHPFEADIIVTKFLEEGKILSGEGKNLSKA